MSRPETPGGQDLEAILASIRKTLAGGSPSPSPGPWPVAEAREVKQDATAQAAGPTPAADALPNKLAVALKGTGGRGADEDFADLLAPGPRRDAPPAASVGDGTKTDTATREQDPLWFLTRRPADKTADNTKAAGEDIELTRPETVRASFPPLFSAPGERPLIAEGVKPAADAGSPDTSRGQEAGKGAAQLSAKATNPTAKDPAASSVPTPSAAGSAGAVKADNAPDAGPAKKETGQDREPQRAETPGADAAQAAVFGGAQAKDFVLAPLASAARAEMVAKWAARPDTPARALEEAIAQLLEPLLRQWLESNLPRLVAGAIREEVARGLEAERERTELKI